MKTVLSYLTSSNDFLTAIVDSIVIIFLNLPYYIECYIRLDSCLPADSLGYYFNGLEMEN